MVRARPIFEKSFLISKLRLEMQARGLNETRLSSEESRQLNAIGLPGKHHR